MRVCPVTAIVGGQTRDSGKPEAFRGLILETLFGCRAYRLYSAKVVNGDFEPGFTMNLGLKNLGLAAAASQTLGRTLPCSMRVPARMAKTVRPGMGETVRRPSPTTPRTADVGRVRDERTDIGACLATEAVLRERASRRRQPLSRSRVAWAIWSAEIPAAAMSSAGVPEPGRSRTARWLIRTGWPASLNASRTALPMPPAG